MIEEEKEPEKDEDSELLDHEEHSDSPGPFGTGEEPTESEAAGNPGVEDLDS